GDAPARQDGDYVVALAADQLEVAHVGDLQSLQAATVPVERAAVPDVVPAVHADRVVDAGIPATARAGLAVETEPAGDPAHADAAVLRIWETSSRRPPWMVKEVIAL